MSFQKDLNIRPAGVTLVGYLSLFISAAYFNMTVGMMIYSFYSKNKFLESYLSRSIHIYFVIILFCAGLLFAGYKTLKGSGVARYIIMAYILVLGTLMFYLGPSFTSFLTTLVLFFITLYLLFFEPKAKLFFSSK